MKNEPENPLDAMRSKIARLIAARVDVREAEMTNDQGPMTSTGRPVEHWALAIEHWELPREPSHD